MIIFLFLLMVILIISDPSLNLARSGDEYPEIGFGNIVCWLKAFLPFRFDIFFVSSLCNFPYLKINHRGN